MIKPIQFSKMRILAPSLLLVISICFCACKKDKKCENSETGVLKNLTDLDGCGWTIRLSNGTTLEPLNLQDFDIELVENKPVCVRYQERPDMGSYCMTGKIVQIETIE